MQIGSCGPLSTILKQDINLIVHQLAYGSELEQMPHVECQKYMLFTQ